MSTALIAYVPVIHGGYKELFERWKGADIYLIDTNLATKYTDVRAKIEIRALDVQDVARYIWNAMPPPNLNILISEKHLRKLQYDTIVMANDEVCRRIARAQLPHKHVQFDDIFLRWDSTHVFSKNEIHYDRISRLKTDRLRIQKAEEEAKKTSDWWRAVGALIIKKSRVMLSAYNRHVPSEYIPYIFGDPRDIIKAGEQSEYASAMHAEQVLIALAAEQGISLKGTDIYLTTFPCPLCAKLVAFSGIRRCFVKGGHASLDGENVLRARGVEIILVK